MKYLWLVTHLPDSPSVPIVMNAARSMDIELEIREPGSIRLDENKGHAPSRLPDVVFTRLGSSADDSDICVIEQLEQAGVRCVNSATAIRLARNKTDAQRTFELGDVPCPRTFIVENECEFAQVRDHLGAPPWVLKDPVSCQGAGVELIHSEQELSDRGALVLERNPSAVVQEFMTESAGSDLRVLVVGGQVRAAMRRRSSSDDFRSNLHVGGQAESVPMTGEIADVAEKAARAIGLDVAGIDLLETRSGLLVIEANAAPGLAGLQKVSDINLGELILSHLGGLR